LDDLLCKLTTQSQKQAKKRHSTTPRRRARR
jgi:hypothetical protein